MSLWVALSAFFGWPFAAWQSFRARRRLRARTWRGRLTLERVA
jgi:hypothetical protein